MKKFIRRLQIARIHRHLKVSSLSWSDHHQTRSASANAIKNASYSSLQRRVRNALYQYDPVLKRLPEDRVYLVEVALDGNEEGRHGRSGTIAVFDHTRHGTTAKIRQPDGRRRHGLFHFLLHEGKLSAVHCCDEGHLGKTRKRPVTAYKFTPEFI